jgi:hypothetical protein
MIKNIIYSCLVYYILLSVCYSIEIGVSRGRDDSSLPEAVSLIRRGVDEEVIYIEIDAREGYSYEIHIAYNGTGYIFWESSGIWKKTEKIYYVTRLSRIYGKAAVFTVREID